MRTHLRWGLLLTSIFACTANAASPAEGYAQALSLAPAESIEALGRVRAELWAQNAERLAAWKPDPSWPAEAQRKARAHVPVQLSAEELALLRHVHQARAKRFLDLGKTESALREVLVSANESGVPFVQCASGEADCVAVRAAVARVLPSLCLEGCRARVLTNEGGLFSALEGTTLSRAALAWVAVTGVSNEKGRRVVRGIDANGTSYQDCIGQFETDKIKEVTETAIIIERTTWCRQLVDKKSKGLKLSYVVPAGEPVEAGDLLLLRVDGRAEVSRGARDVATFENTAVVQRSHRGACELAGQSVECKALRQLPYAR